MLLNASTGPSSFLVSFDGSELDVAELDFITVFTHQIFL